MKLPNSNVEAYDEEDMIQTEDDFDGDDNLDDVEDEDDGYDDLGEDDEDEEEPEEDAEGDSDDEDDAEEDESDEDEEPEGPVKFTKEQQRAVDKIIQSRLERTKTQLSRQLSQTAGVQLEPDDVFGAAKLWGLLKSNPTLADAVDVVITSQLKAGKAKEVSTEESMRVSELSRKEAIIDLKEADPIFRKHSDKILDWAEDQGYSVDDKKSLKLAYMAWKGSQRGIIDKAKQAGEQKKQQSKEVAKKRAATQTGVAKKAKTTPSDFRKMSDKAVLARTGVKLFTDD